MTVDACQRQLAYLTAPIGVRGSGGARYAAAMHFYNEGQMPAAMLEIYRRCSKFDLEEPIDLARIEGVEIPKIALTSAQTYGA